MRFLHFYTSVFGWRVRGGPFRGMRYVRESVGSAFAPKLLGSYELELADWIETLIARQPAKVLNLGAAEGYYAVGFALRSPRTRVVAFEAEPDGQALIALLAAHNGVAGRIAIEGFCTVEMLARHLAAAEPPLLIVDIEGGEMELIDPQRLPALRGCTLLIELHENEKPAGDILRARFAATHVIEERWARPRTRADLPAQLRQLARFVAPHRFVAAMDERRAWQMRWFLCTPRPGGAAHA
jgi:hypothetical protein